MVDDFADILKLKVRVSRQDLGIRHAFADHPHDGGNRDAQSPNARNPSHMIGVYRDSFELLHLIIPCAEFNTTLRKPSLTPI
jgi:hypothetical protein